ncbi:spermatogenesis-associated protein 22-like [Anopheles nili]|uniref:spermatogenesis-associated protein 22-like n=1 Tax=Anopheles nili TaxID=185578 RepID=UPI00237BC780|nr:spermatogenesis-associated protein 22-like [Anopheles nili]
MSFNKSSSFNQPFCPKTPTPRINGSRFPMSAAFLETPSIMDSFLKTSAVLGNVTSTSTGPPAKQFIMENLPNDSMPCNGNTSIQQLGKSSCKQTSIHSNEFNNSILDEYFSSSFLGNSSVNRKSPLAPSCNNSYASNNLDNQLSKSFHREQKPFDNGCNAVRFTKSILSTTRPSGLSNSTLSVGESANKNDPKSTLRIVSGTIEHIQKLIREQSTIPLLLETVATVVNVKSAKKPSEKLILLRHRNQGPVLQGVFYEIDIQLPILSPGDVVRCVGRIQPVGNRFQILKIARTPERYVGAMLRLQTVSAFSSKVRR